MSYILDALKKSEAERSRGVVPTLLAPQQTPLRGGMIGWLVAGALLVNAALFAAWMYWPTTKDKAPPNLPVSAAPIAAAPPASTEQQPVGRVDDRRAEATAPIVAPYSAAPAPAVGPPVYSPNVASAPEQPRIIAPNRAVPATAPNANSFGTSAAVDNAAVQHYEFSTHVYASDPSKRAVTLNGKRYMEGDTLDPGVRIKEITEAGVLLEVDGQTVPIDVLQDWR